MKTEPFLSQSRQVTTIGGRKRHRRSRDKSTQLKGVGRILPENELERATMNYACGLSIATLSAVTNHPAKELTALTRSSPDIAFARQIAMYLAHTKFGISYAQVGAYFQRDRSTVAHACRLIEESRDDAGTDQYILRMEALIDFALPPSFEIQEILSQRFIGHNQ